MNQSRSETFEKTRLEIVKRLEALPSLPEFMTQDEANAAWDSANAALLDAWARLTQLCRPRPGATIPDVDRVRVAFEFSEQLLLHAGYSVTPDKSMAR